MRQLWPIQVRGYTEDEDGSCCNRNRHGTECTTYNSHGTAHGGICNGFRCQHGVDSPSGNEWQNLVGCGHLYLTLNKIHQTCLQDGYTGGRCDFEGGEYMTLHWKSLMRAARVYG